MIIPIKTNPKKFFRQLIGLLSSFPPIKGLRPREQDVLAEIMYQTYVVKDISEELRPVVVFSTKGRQKICNRLSISKDTLYNTLSILRKTGVLYKDNTLPLFLNILPGDTYELSVNFKVEKDVD